MSSRSRSGSMCRASAAARSASDRHPRAIATSRASSATRSATRRSPTARHAPEQAQAREAKGLLKQFARALGELAARAPPPSENDGVIWPHCDGWEFQSTSQQMNGSILVS